MANKEKIKRYKAILGFVFVLGILCSINSMYSVEERNYASEFLGYNKLENTVGTLKHSIEDFNETINYIKEKDNSFYRISKYPYKFDNASMFLKYNCLGGYYSIIPKTHQELCGDLSNIQYELNQGTNEFDGRTKITTLLGVKYQIRSKNNASVPYGYSLINEYKGKSQIYKNNYALPFGVLYTDYISEEEYESFTPLEKESSLLKTVVIKKKDVQAIPIKPREEMNDSKTIKEVEYQLKDDKKIVAEDKITVKNVKNNTLKLNIGEVKNSEIYVLIEGINYRAFTKEEYIELETNDKSSKIEIEQVKEKYRWYQPNYEYTVTAKLNNIVKEKKVEDYLTSAYYIKNSEMLFNLGYYDKISGEITLAFSKIGDYQYNNIKIYAVSMEDYEADVQNLQKSNFEVIKYENGYLQGKANVEESGVLQFSTMYHKGWKVYVDEKEVDTLEVNKYFLGIPIEKGEHRIELKYYNPYVIPGLFITILGSILWIATIIFQKIRKDRRKV